MADKQNNGLKEGIDAIITATKLPPAPATAPSTDIAALLFVANDDATTTTTIKQVHDVVDVWGGMMRQHMMGGMAGMGGMGGGGMMGGGKGRRRKGAGKKSSIREFENSSLIGTSMFDENVV